MVFLWVALYGLTYAISDMIPQGADTANWIPPLAMILYAGLLILWICRTGQAGHIGLCAMRHFPPGEYLSLLPLLSLPLCNLLAAEEYRFRFSSAVLMLSVSATEEIFFRGFLLRFFTKRSKLSGIFLTSGIFALFHCVNLFHAAGLPYTLMQVLFAFAAGICYGAVTIRCGSLFPCIFAHFLTNITGTGNSLPVGAGWIGPWICLAVYVFYGRWLCGKIR